MYPAEFAQVYDQLMDDFDYPAWAAHYLALAARAGCARPLSLCECGCGTGSMAIEWAKMGLRVTGIDLSSDMLRAAQEKARAAGVMVPFICQDMCALTLPRPVDAIFCPCDGLNYLVELDRVRAFFGRAHAFLKPGGVLAFDVSTAHKLLNMGDAPYFEDRPDISYFWKNQVADHLVTMDLTFFRRQPGGLYKRFDERQVQRAHTQAELVAALADAGFCAVQVFGERTLDAPAKDATRIHLLAKRAG
ncbi:MAG: class I SAM-dependent methyltransferase [Clostridia bacterium]